MQYTLSISPDIRHCQRPQNPEWRLLWRPRHQNRAPLLRTNVALAPASEEKRSGQVSRTEWCCSWIKLNQIESDWVRLNQIESDWQALGRRTEEPKNRRIRQFFVPSARNGDTQSLFRSEATRLSLLQSTELTISWVLKPQKPQMKPIYDSMWWHSMWWQEYLYRLPEETSANYVYIERKCQPFAYAPPLSPSRLPEAICWQVLLLKKMPIMMMVLKCIECIDEFLLLLHSGVLYNMSQQTAMRSVSVSERLQ